MQNINFIPIDYNNFDYEGKNYFNIIGRDDKGKRISLIDNLEVYFWAIFNEGTKEKKINEISEEIAEIKIRGKNGDSKVLKTEIYEKNFLGKNYKAIKVFISNYKDAREIAKKIKFKEIFKIREYDIPYTTKYILEKKLRPLNWYEIEGSVLSDSEEFGGIQNIEVDLCLKLESFKEIKKEDFHPKVLAFDIETENFEIGKGEILMISLVGENFKKVISHRNNSHHNFFEKVKNEAELIEKFVYYVKKNSPDILTGYFSDGFDLPYIKSRAEKLKVELNLGLDNSTPKFRKGAVLTGRINGIVHLDLFKFIKTVYSQYLQSETLKLNDVAEELLGEKKHVWEFIPINKIDSDKWDEFFEYNLKDGELTYKLFQKIWADIYEFTTIIEEPLFDLSRYSMSNLVENYIIHNLDKYNEITEKKPPNESIKLRREEGKYEGAFVFQPIAGLYENLVFFDFTSMYGSIIVSFNLSKESYIEKKDKNVTEVDIGRKVYFSKDTGFFSKMLKDIIKKRKEYKKEYNKNPSPLLKARSNAFKLLSNASYGYLGFFGARYYCREAAASAAAIARSQIKTAISNIEKKGYKVVYGDTDSISFLQGNKTKKDIHDLLDEINSKLPGIMELDLEGFFKRGIWVTKRTGEFGAKKKYALLGEDDKIKIKGFETVRRDWCDLARKTQNKILELILKDGNEKRALEYLKKIINQLKRREINIKELIIRTQLKKPISNYKSISPHVSIAEKMKKIGMDVSVGTLIEYYISESNDKKSLIRERAKLPDEKGIYNMEYYLKNQILPAVENILEIFQINVNELFDGERQRGLVEYG